MDNDTQAIVIGLSAGLGGFAGFLIVGCICWQVCCGSWCDKKSVQTKIKPLPGKTQRHVTTVTRVHNSNIPAMTPMKNINVTDNAKATSPNDLASKVKSARR